MTFKEWANEVVNSEKFYEPHIDSFYSVCELAWNHQQAKIDAVIELINGDKLGDYAVLGDFRRDIEEILK